MLVALQFPAASETLPMARRAWPAPTDRVYPQATLEHQTAAMTFPPTLPDWLPWWLAIAVLVPALIFVLAFLAMPFSVFGVKSRLELIEARLDEIQGEIRALALRLPEAGGPQSTRPPIPPAADRAPPDPRRRAEPRLDWPR